MCWDVGREREVATQESVRDRHSSDLERLQGDLAGRARPGVAERDDAAGDTDEVDTDRHRRSVALVPSVSGGVILREVSRRYLPIWKVEPILSIMENTATPTPDEAAATLADAEASRTLLARRLVLPSFFFLSIGTAIAVQIATSALGIADLSDDGVWGQAGWLMVGGLLTFAAVATIQLMRFRTLNGLWLGGFASRVVGGTAAAASVSYVLTFGAAIGAALAAAWWLMVLCSLAGGLAYAMSGRRWVRIYRGQPAAHARGESVAWLAAVGALAVTGLVLLVVGR